MQEHDPLIVDDDLIRKIEGSGPGSSWSMSHKLQRNVKKLAQVVARTCSIDFQLEFNKEMERMERTWSNAFQERCPLNFDGDSMKKLEGIDPGSIW